MIEKILVTLVSVILFLYIFVFKVIKKNDTNYFIILGMQAVGILINFIQILFGTLKTSIFNVLIYFFSIIVPIIIFILEYKNINVSELISLSIANIYIFEGNTKKAKNILIKLVTKYNNSDKGHKKLAKIYEQEGGMRKAIDEYVKVLDIKKDDYVSYYKIAVLLNDLGKKSEAIQMLQTLLKSKPENYDANKLLAELLIEKEQYKKAISYLNTAIKYNEDKIDLLYNLGVSYTKINEFTLAIECYKKIVTMDNTYYNAYFRLGQIALLYRDFDAAEQYFTNSAYKEKEAKSYFELTKIHIIKNRKDKACLDIKKTIDLDYTYYEIAKNEPMLFPIKDFIVEPKNKIKKENEESEKEKMIENYLNDTYSLTKILNSKKENNLNNMKWNKN